MRRNLGPPLLVLAFCLLAGEAFAQPAKSSPRTFTYKKAGETAVEADVYRADDDKDRPVVVWLHGGALIVGSRKDVPGRLLDFCRREGFILVSLDYRLAPEAKLPEIAGDVRDAFAWLHEQGSRLFGADTRRVAVAGGSAGGYLTLLSGTLVKPRPRALVAYWGYGDVDGDWYTRPSAYYREKTPLVSREDAEKAVGKEVLTNTDAGAEVRKARADYYRYLRQNGLWTRTVTGFDPDRERARIDPFCPVRNVTPDYPPTLLVHGTEDNDVPYEQSAAMARELARHKVPHELITVRGAGHGLAGGDAGEAARAHEKALEFLREHLRR